MKEYLFTCDEVQTLNSLLTGVVVMLHQSAPKSPAFMLVNKLLIAIQKECGREEYIEDKSNFPAMALVFKKEEEE